MCKPRPRVSLPVVPILMVACAGGLVWLVAPFVTSALAIALVTASAATAVAVPWAVWLVIRPHVTARRASRTRAAAAAAVHAETVREVEAAQRHAIAPPLAVVAGEVLCRSDLVTAAVGSRGPRWTA